MTVKFTVLRSGSRGCTVACFRTRRKPSLGPRTRRPVSCGPETSYRTSSAMCQQLSSLVSDRCTTVRIKLGWGYCLARTLRDRKSRKSVQGCIHSVSWQDNTPSPAPPAVILPPRRPKHIPFEYLIFDGLTAY